MLTEIDMRARFIAATLSAIENELRHEDISADTLLALSRRMRKVTVDATRIADELELAQQAGAGLCSQPHLQPGDNIIVFDKSRRVRCAR